MSLYEEAAPPRAAASTNLDTLQPNRSRPRSAAFSAPPGRVMPAVDAQEIARVLEHEALPCSEVARRLGRRKADVLASLVAEPALFERSGRGRGSRWGLRRSRTELSVQELSRRADAALALIESGALAPIDGLTMVVWPEHVRLIPDVAAAA